MKARFLTLASLVAVLAVLALAPVAQAQVVESATGAGHITLGSALRTFSFNAVERADGSVMGKIHFNNRANRQVLHGEVECLSVVGNTAYLSGVITKSRIPGRVGLTFATAVQDNGEGQDAPPDMSTLVVQGVFAVPAEEVCELQSLFAQPLLPIESGNVQVRP